jgi:electron transfer flavoprotein beta subunit
VKVLVAVKHVVDYHVKVRVKTDGSDIETKNVKKSINPFDEIAVEAAIQLKEQGKLSEIVVVSIGAVEVEATLRHALALGADRAILVESNHCFEPLAVAKVLKKIVEQESPACVIMGKQAIDDDCNQTGQMLAALLNYPQATCVSKLELNEQHIIATREIDEGLERLKLCLPCVITTDLRLNTPRYVSLPNIMKSKQKPIRKLMLQELELTLKPHVLIEKVSTPPERKAGIKVNSFSELMRKLVEEAQVL